MESPQADPTLGRAVTSPRNGPFRESHFFEASGRCRTLTVGFRTVAAWNPRCSWRATLDSERQEVVAIKPAGQPLSGTHTFHARAPEMYASPDTG
jgi:hypothetical protein